MTIDYNLTEKEQKQVRHIAHQVRIAAENIRLERLKGNRLSTVREAARILEEEGRVELSKQLLATL